MSFEAKAERKIGGLLDRIPGYRGYRAKEDRRDADRRVRDRLVTALGQAADRVERVGRDLADRRRIKDVGPVDEFAKGIRHLADRINTASYGYGGLFGDRPVGEAALDQLRRFDEGMLAGVDELDASIRALEEALAGVGDIAGAARAGSTAVRAIHARWDLRGEVVETAEPAPEERVLAVLQPAAPAPTSHPAYDLHDGDAVDILGDHYLIDARIEVEAGERSFRLFRLGSGTPERWLYAPRRSDGGLATLSPSDLPYQSGPNPTVGEEAFTVSATATGEGEVIGTGGASGRRSVTVELLTGTGDPTRRALVLDWGNERQVLVGQETHPDDVDIFRRT